MRLRSANANDTDKDFDLTWPGCSMLIALLLGLLKLKRFRPGRDFQIKTNANRDA